MHTLHHLPAIHPIKTDLKTPINKGFLLFIDCLSATSSFKLYNTTHLIIGFIYYECVFLKWDTILTEILMLIVMSLQ